MRLVQNWKIQIGIALVLLSGLPLYVGFFHYINNGGLDWPMVWGNEQRYWSMIFSPLAVLGMCLSYSLYAINKTLFYGVTIVATCMLFLLLYDVLLMGFAPSSKIDSDNLDLLGFWISKWWQ